MDLIVLIEDTPHCVSGLVESTTVAQVIFALCHSTKQKGRFLLLAQDSNKSVIHLSPDDSPFHFLNEADRKNQQFSFQLVNIEKTSNIKPTDDTDSFECRSDNSHRPFSFAQDSNQTGTYSEVEIFSNSTPKMPSNNSSCSTLSEQAKTSERRTSTNRHPPPDYNKLLEERIFRKGSDARTSAPLTFLNIPNFSLKDLYERSFTREELETLIKIQERILSSQKEELIRMETTQLNSLEQEMMQLLRQHNNLQNILNSLRNSNWKERLESEKRESERLNTAIAAMSVAVENKGRELYEAIQFQKALEVQIEVEQSASQKQSYETPSGVFAK